MKKLKRTKSIEIEENDQQVERKRTNLAVHGITYTSNDRITDNLYYKDPKGYEMHCEPKDSHKGIKATQSKIINKRNNKNQLELACQINKANNKSIHMEDINLAQSPQSKGIHSLKDNNAVKTLPERAQNNLNKDKNIKLPSLIKESIGSLASGQKKPPKQLTELSKTLLTKFKQINKRFICQICSCEYEQKQKAKIGKCSHEFCDSCLRHYVDYKIARFEEVFCPAEGCNEVLDISDDFYKTLNIALKEKYNKIHNFYAVSQNSNIRLCPNDKCEDGVLILQEKPPLKCKKCGSMYCPKCFLPHHQGPCQNNQVDFFQNNFHFRQCSNCKSIVQKTAGCDHITCRCKYQFCYLCGGEWLYGHICRSQAQIQSQAQTQSHVECFECFYGCGGDGLFGILVRVLLKLIICLPLFLLFSIFIVFVMALTFSVLLFCTLLLGLFPYAINFMCNKSGLLFLILFILFPLSMIVGIVTAFREFFCEVTPDFMGTYFNIIKSSFHDMLAW